MPSGTPITSASTIDSTASSIVTGRERAVSSRTLAWLRAENPRLPVNRLPSHVKNWTSNGWSSP